MSTGAVTRELVRAIREQVERHGLVVWYDPNSTWERSLGTLEEEGIRVERFRGSFFELRHRVEPLLREQSPPRLVVWVPLAHEATHQALVELEAAGVVMAPGQQPAARNTRLAVVARRAFEGGVAADQVERLVRQVERGKLGLEDLERWDGEAPADTSILSAVFGTTDPVALARSFVADPGLDGELVARGAVGELSAFLSRWTELPPADDGTPADLRHRLVRHLVEVDLLATAGSGADAMVESLGVPGVSAAARSLIERLLGEWRADVEARKIYAEVARDLEPRYAEELASVDPVVLAGVQTFPLVDRLLAAHVEETLLAGDGIPSEALPLIRQRREGFWASMDETILLRWDLLGRVAAVLGAARGLEEQLAAAGAGVDELAARYVGTGGGEGWCGVDTQFRRMEELYHRADLDLSVAERDRLERLVARARTAYTRATDALATAFVEALWKAEYAIPGIPPQREVYQRAVSPVLEAGRVAYVLVDGLRFEMGRELVALLGKHGEVERVEILPFQAQLPTITPVGMGCLMPWAHQAPELAAVDSGVALRLGETLLRTRADRVRYMERVVGEGFVELKLDALLPARKRIREKLASARLALVTATDELDQLCESANTAMAHRLMGDVLGQLSRAVRTLIGEGFESVVITADHGFLLGTELEAGTKIDPPGGETVELHRRVWIGRGGAAGHGFVRLAAGDVGLGGDLELAVPAGTGAFKVAGGSAAYFHGGASPQELLIPVITVAGKPGGRESGGGGVRWELALGSRAISSPFVSVQVAGTREGLFVEDLPRVRVEVLEKRTMISRTVSAVYGHQDQSEWVAMELDPDSGDPRSNTVVVQLDPVPTAAAVEIRLVEAEHGRVLARLKDVPVKMAGF